VRPGLCRHDVYHVCRVSATSRRQSWSHCSSSGNRLTRQT
jgi:hypothetical protein